MTDNRQVKGAPTTISSRPQPYRKLDEKLESKSQDTSNMLCYNCDNKGHRRADCPLPKDEAKITANMEKYRKTIRSMEMETEMNDMSEVNTLKFKIKMLVNHLKRKTKENISKPLMTLDINGLEVTGRVDSGADITALPASVARVLQLKPVTFKETPLVAVNNSEVQILGLAPVWITYRN